MDGTGTASTLFAAPGNNLCGVAVNPRPARSTGPTSAPTRSGSATWTGRGLPRPCPQTPGGSAPSGVAVDPANNKIYWTNQFSDEVRAGNLDGSGTAQTLFSGEDNPIGVAADPAAGKIYWTDLNSGTVRVGPLGGSTVGAAQTLFNAASPRRASDRPHNEQDLLDQLDVRVGDPGREPDGSGTPSTLFSGESTSLFAALVKTPVNTGLPAISGGAKAGKELTCQNGTWAPDLLASFLFRAPASFTYQW